MPSPMAAPNITNDPSSSAPSNPNGTSHNANIAPNTNNPGHNEHRVFRHQQHPDPSAGSLNFLPQPHPLDHPVPPATFHSSQVMNNSPAMAASASGSAANFANSDPNSNSSALTKVPQPIPKKSAVIKTDRPRPHVCLTCTRAFARLEHLKRHERSHTNEKPYQCAACGRCFARRDLVLRHQQKLHAGLMSNSSTINIPTSTSAPPAKDEVSSTAGATSATSVTSVTSATSNPAEDPSGKNPRGRSKNYNSNIIEHKNNTAKIKPLPGQTGLPPTNAKLKRVNSNNKDGKSKAGSLVSNNINRVNENANITINGIPQNPNDNRDDFDHRLQFFQANGFMPDSANIAPPQHYLFSQQGQPQPQLFNPVFQQQQQQQQRQPNSQQHYPQQLHPQQFHPQQPHPQHSQHNVPQLPPPQAHLQTPDNGNLNKLTNSSNNPDNSSNSTSTSPNDSLYNSNSFSPSSTLNSMSRTATNDVPFPPPMGLSSSSLTRVESNVATGTNANPLRRISSGGASKAMRAHSNVETSTNASHSTITNEADDLLASFQVFSEQRGRPAQNNSDVNDDSNTHQHHQQQQSQQQQQQHHHHHRHASFSAASAISYTLPDEAQSIHEHDIPEAPHQVGFSTPQMSATELASKVLLSGADVDSLGIDWESLENFSLNKGGNSEKQQHPHPHPHSNDQQDAAMHYFTNSDNTGHSTSLFHPLNNGEGVAHNQHKNIGGPNNHHHNGNFFLDAPLLQEYLHVGGAGGGAGFDDTKSFIKPTLNNQNSGSPRSADGSKKSCSEPLQDNWLDEFIRTPFDMNIDINHIGFDFHHDHQNGLQEPQQKQLGTPNSGADTPKPSNKIIAGRITKGPKKERSRMAQTDIPSLFRDRQIDLFQQQMMANSNDGNKKPLASHNNISTDNGTFNKSSTASGNNSVSNSNVQSPSSIFNAFAMHSSYPANFNFDLFTKDIRNHILSSNSLNDNQFPSIGELNSYIFLYYKEFDNYFPFVHLPSIESGVDNIPLLLAVAAIGALYSFHSSNSLLLFGVSKFYIHNFLEKNKDFQHNNIPLWLIQCLTLNMFLGIFNNDESLNKSIAKQLNSLIYLVKKCSLHLPLEQFVTPPPVFDGSNSNTNNQNNSPAVLKHNFDYFILAQSRIRTVHTILLISVLFDTLIGAPIVLKSEDIKCGSPCVNEELWKASNFQKWFQLLINEHIVIDSKFTLIQLSNGESFSDLLNSLNNLDYMELMTKNVGLRTSLSLLMNVHQSIYERRVELEKQEIDPNMKATKWRMNDRPELEHLLKYWELLFIKNNGILIPNKSNLELINKSPVLKLILPLLYFAKIRFCLSITPILEKVWVKDWEGMNDKLAHIESDSEALRESAKYSLSIIELWIDLISVFNDAQKTSRKTPIFFLTCTFTAILFLSEYLYAIETLSTNPQENSSFSSKNSTFTAVDTALFIRVSNVLKKVSTTVTPDSANNKTFSEFLKIQANGALDFDNNLCEEFCENLNIHKNNEGGAGTPDAGMSRLAQFIKSSRLSSKCLYLGVRILADAPIWPAAVLFAEALKARSMAISKTNESTPASNFSG